MDKISTNIVVGRNRIEQIDLPEAGSIDSLSKAVEAKANRAGAREREVRIGVHTNKNGEQVLYIRKQNWKDAIRESLGIGKRLDQNLAEASNYVQDQLANADPQGKRVLNTIQGLIDSLNTDHSIKFSELSNRLGDLSAINQTKSHALARHPRIEARMEAYDDVMVGKQSKAHQQLRDHPDSELSRCLENSQMRVYSSLAGAERDAMAFQRDLVNIGMKPHFTEEQNEKILGCKTSHARAVAPDATTPKPALQPGNQLSIAMRTPWMRSDEAVVHPVVLSVSAPALDALSQPERPIYVQKGILNTDRYKESYEALCSHIKQCAQHHPGHRVVLSAVGMGSFIGGLRGSERSKAEDVASTAFANMIAELHSQGAEVSFSDDNPGSSFWISVNNKLAQASGAPIACLGKIPGDWLTNGDILVNAWDPHSIVGNGCAGDDSFDGYVGRSSLCHDMHTLACILQSQGLAALDADGKLHINQAQAAITPA